MKPSLPSRAPDVECSPVYEAMLTALAEFSFRFRLCASFRGGSFFRDPPCTVHRAPALAPAPHAITLLHRATSSMGPPLLTAKQKQIRVQMVIELLQVLSVQSMRQWHDIVTLDES
jgi:hypothetical protein